MSNRIPSSVARDRLWTFGLAVLLPLLAMMLRGVDGNWDLRNYHLYNVHAWLTGRMAIDIAPAQQQSFHNPLLDLPLYLLHMSGLGPRWAGAWLTLPAMASLFFLLRLQRNLSPAPPTRSSQLVMVLMALTGAAMFSTLALSMNDAFVAAAMLGSLLLVLPAARPEAGPLRLIGAGLLAGAFTGLKLTAIIYCLALAAMALVQGDWRQRALRLGQLAIGGAVGFAATYGYWGWRLFAIHGNPFFPYYNNLFQSPDALPLTWADPRFRPESWLDALAAPAYLVQRTRHFSELTLSDPRLLIGLLALAGLWLLQRRDASSLREKTTMLLVFFVTALLAWVWQYGIYRYAIVLEALACLALVLVLQRLPRWQPLALIVALLLVSADTKRPNWGLLNIERPLATLRAPELGANAMVLIAWDEPVAYLALGLPGSVPVISVHNNFMSPLRCTRLQARANALVATHEGPIWLLSVDGDPWGEAQQVLTRHYRLEPDAPCLDYDNPLAPAKLCKQRRDDALRRSEKTGCRVK